MSRTRHRGSSLLEVMVAILILSFGLLGLGGLAAAAQRYVKMAQFQSIGTLMATDLGERMRGNINGFSKGLYVRANAYSTTAVELPTCATPSACTSAELAALDMAQWVGELQKRLPGGDAHVKLDPANALATDIWILWIDPKASKELSVADASTDCPAAALAGIADDAPKPRCMYYRISL
nr:type IV pilus modification protein PilV [Variovorax sp. PBS-H4]